MPIVDNIRPLFADIQSFHARCGRDQITPIPLLFRMLDDLLMSFDGDRIHASEARPTRINLVSWPCPRDLRRGEFAAGQAMPRLPANMMYVGKLAQQ